jgi:signal transduction histidine kinase
MFKALKLLSKPSAVSSGVVVGLAAVLVVLALLQYRWSGEVSEAAGARMKAGLQASMMSFRQDVHRELGAIATAFQADSGSGLGLYSQHYASWSQTAARPALVANLFIFQAAGGGQPRLLRLDRAANQFEPVEWPARFSRLQERLAAMSSDFAGMPRFRPPDEARRSPAARPSPERRGPFGAPWFVEENIPALVHPLVTRSPENVRSPHAQRPTMDWLIVELEPKVLREHLLPDLAERHFSGAEGLEYSLAIVSGTAGAPPLYSSDPGFAANGTAESDATLEIFGPPGPPGPGRGIFQPRPQTGQTSGRQYEARQPRLEPLHYAAQDKDWLLIVKHRKGSLDAVVAGMRRRMLAISFGVLLVLAATMAMIIVASQRAHRLAQLQMDFVAGVSHELRTPLAVISSAADNIAAGVVDGRPQLMRYGHVIKKQSAQLTHLVEQILLFASMRKERPQYSLRPLAVTEIVAAALNSMAELLHERGITVEQAVAPDLPPVLGELPALSQCLQNLITNAMKYGGADRWIGIRAAADSDHRQYVRISVEDHGAGIDHADLARIFEAFYRTPAATAAQIHGSGLGLPLAKSIAEAMGGRLDAHSEPGKGSSFTLSLRVAGEIAAEAAAGAHPGPSA